LIETLGSLNEFYKSVLKFFNFLINLVGIVYGGLSEALYTIIEIIKLHFAFRKQCFVYKRYVKEVESKYYFLMEVPQNSNKISGVKNPFGECSTTAILQQSLTI